MSPVPARRPAFVQPPAPPTPVEGVNFGSLDFYSGGFQLPEGDYALEFEVVMNQATDKNGTPKGPMRLGVMLTAHSLTTIGPPQQQFISMGSKAHESFAPNPDTGKGLVAVPGGAGSTANNKTNWYFFLKSMYDTGLPEGTLTNDFTVIDGVWVHTQNVPEPEDRKGFGSAQTGEVEQERRNGLMTVVGQILDGGKPWEGGGGIPVEGAPAVAPKAGPKAVARPAARPAVRAAAPAPVVEEAAPAGDEDVLTAAVNGATAVLEKSPNGCTKLLMRTGTFKAVQTAAGDDMAQAVIETFFGSDAALNTVLNTLGYAVVGASVKPQA